MVDYELNELKRQFLAEAEGKVLEIERVLEGERDGAALERLAYLAHQLKGSGGSYGYQTISSDAAEIEKAVEKLAGGNGDTSLTATIREHVGSLRMAIETSARELVTAPA
jgi:HPt (histidine-containing phosphotransfer) domain-containing protein